MKIDNAIKRLEKEGYEVENKAGVIFTAKKGNAIIEFVKQTNDNETFYFDVGGNSNMPFSSLKAAIDFANLYV